MGYLAILLMACMAGCSQSHLVNNLVHDSALPTCTSLVQRASHRPGLSAPMPPDLRGKWLSTSCETRPGPRYVLRSYTFHRDGTFHLSLHTYRDPSCAHPAHTLAAHGRLTLGRPSWVTPGGTEAEYTLTRVEVVAHTHRDAALVAALVNASCPGKISKPWKPHKPHTVLSYTETANEVTEDEDCGRGLGGAWHELQLLRVEITAHPRRGQQQKEAAAKEEEKEDDSSTLTPRTELLLGDLHTDVDKQDIYRPTGYQPPLLNAKYGSECGVCSAVGRSNERSPAHLHAGPALPLLLAGAWASTRCETRPYGMFLTRNLLFSPAGQEWSMVLRYYHDPECSRPSFTLKATGTYTHAMPTPYAHDFNVTRLVLTPEDSDIATALNSYKGKECGQPGKWAPKKSQDVTSTGGCQAMGVRVPVIEKEIICTGVDEKGGMWLKLGQTPTTPRQMGDSSRPTSWGPPLVSCRPYNTYEQDNSLRPMMGARTASPATSIYSNPVIIALFVFLPLTWKP
ncbi:LOW QUALITY PROTEIN: protein APCDD1-like [Panulirus ornatus]|uniref:LOW QUALITY PROTEIN: protein APCDD1-like n=1 Tax=Panulirus ornatus TaxID=150431 RepID=UPI003A843986